MASLNVCFMGGRQAGCIGLLSVLAAGCEVRAAVAYDEKVAALADALGVPRFGSVKEGGFQELLSESDLLVSTHGREIVPPDVLRLSRLGGINAHPCLYAYKGARPVERLLKDGNTKASVGVHRMVERVDEGEVILERFVDVTGMTTPLEVYNALYPVYAMALIESLRVVAATQRGE